MNIKKYLLLLVAFTFTINSLNSMKRAQNLEFSQAQESDQGKTKKSRAEDIESISSSDESLENEMFSLLSKMEGETSSLNDCLDSLATSITKSKTATEDQNFFIQKIKETLELKQMKKALEEQQSFATLTQANTGSPNVRSRTDIPKPSAELPFSPITMNPTSDFPHSSFDSLLTTSTFLGDISNSSLLPVDATGDVRASGTTRPFDASEFFRAAVTPVPKAKTFPYRPGVTLSNAQNAFNSLSFSLPPTPILNSLSRSAFSSRFPIIHAKCLTYPPASSFQSKMHNIIFDLKNKFAVKSEEITTLNDFNIKIEGKYLIHWLCQFDKHELICLLKPMAQNLSLEADLEINGLLVTNASPWHFIAKFNSLATAKRLLDFNYDINAKAGQDNLTPLHVAVNENKLDIVKFLIEYNANVNESSFHGYSPLHLAIINQNIKSGEEIIKAKDLNIDLADDEGNTALHYGVMKRNLHVIKQLLKSNANVLAKNKVGKTPLEYAIEIGNQTIIDILRDKISIPEKEKPQEPVIDLGQRNQTPEPNVINVLRKAVQEAMQNGNFEFATECLNMLKALSAKK